MESCFHRGHLGWVADAHSAIFSKPLPVKGFLFNPRRLCRHYYLPLLPLKIQICHMRLHEEALLRFTLFYTCLYLSTCSTNNILTLFEVVEHRFATYYIPYMTKSILCAWLSKFVCDTHRCITNHKRMMVFFFITTQRTIAPFGTVTQILLWSLYN